METAANAAQAGATESPDEPAAPVDVIQDGGDLPDEPAAIVKAQPSEMVRLIREVKRLRAQAETSKAPAQQGAPVTRDAVLSEIRAQLAADPEKLIEELAGEDFFALAKRIGARHESPETKLEKLQARIDELEGRTGTHDKRAADEAARAKAAVTDGHVAEIAKMVDALDAKGDPVYPVLSTLDPEALDEPVAMTAYNAVSHAWLLECCQLDANGTPVLDARGQPKQIRKWSEAEVQKRFQGAFRALDAHYGKLRSPKPKTPAPQAPDDESPTIENKQSSGPVERVEEPATGVMDWRQALAKNLKQLGLS